MKLEKIRKAVGDAGQEYQYLSQIALRLHAVLGDDLSFPDSIALMNILMHRTLRYKDGFIVNDLLSPDDDHVIGHADAAVIVTAFWDDLEPTWEQMRSEYPSYNKEDAAYQELFTRVLDRLNRDPAIDRITL
jgi:hypothetical protein